MNAAAPPVLQSHVAGHGFGREAAAALPSAVDGRPVASTHAGAADDASGFPARDTAAS